MNRRLQDSLREFDNSLAKNELLLSGVLGIYLNGERLVEVPNRNSFVYVRLRNNQSELIQAFNDKVSPSFDLPVLVKREGGRYIVIGRDTERYVDWETFSAFLPRHGNTHSLPDNGANGGGDVVWVYGRQFMPALVFPSGSGGGPNVFVSPYVLRDVNGNWKYVGNTGTQNLSQYRPTGTNQAVMGLVYLDSVSGNPYLIINSGTPMPESLTGTGDILPYVPVVPQNNPNFLSLAWVRIGSGTSIMDWDNIYDARQFVSVIQTGTPSAIFVEDEGSQIGSINTINFVGPNVTATLSGQTARVFITGSNYPWGGVAVRDEGVPVGTGTAFNFTGDGVTVSVSGATITVVIPGGDGGGGGGGGGIMFWDNGAPKATGTVINTKGNLAASVSGSVGEIKLLSDTAVFRGSNVAVPSTYTAPIPLSTYKPAEFIVLSGTSPDTLMFVQNGVFRLTAFGTTIMNSTDNGVVSSQIALFSTGSLTFIPFDRDIVSYREFSAVAAHNNSPIGIYLDYVQYITGGTVFQWGTTKALTAATVTFVPYQLTVEHLSRAL